MRDTGHLLNIGKGRFQTYTLREEISLMNAPNTHHQVY